MLDSTESQTSQRSLRPSGSILLAHMQCMRELREKSRLHDQTLSATQVGHQTISFRTLQYLALNRINEEKGMLRREAKKDIRQLLVWTKESGPTTSQFLIDLIEAFLAKLISSSEKSISTAQLGSLLEGLNHSKSTKTPQALQESVQVISGFLQDTEKKLSKLETLEKSLNPKELMNYLGDLNLRTIDLYGKDAVYQKLDEVMEKEASMPEDYYAFYHAHSHDLEIINWVMQSLRETFFGYSHQHNDTLRLCEREASEIPHVIDFLKKIAREIQPSGPRHMPTDTHPEYRKLALCANLSLFGNINFRPDEYTLDFFFRFDSNPGWRTYGIAHDLLEQVFSTLELRHPRKQQYINLIDDYLKTHANASAVLKQIFIHKDCVDKLVVLTGDYGYALPGISVVKKPHEFLDEMTEDIRRCEKKYPLRDRTVNDVQGRIFMQPEYWNDPNKVQIATHQLNAPPLEHKTIFKAQLRALLHEDLAHWLDSHPKQFQNFPLFSRHARLTQWDKLWSIEEDIQPDNRQQTRKGPSV